MTAMIKNIMVRGKRLFPRSSLPNSEGYKFLGYTTDGQKFRCEVVRDDFGEYWIEGMDIYDMIGWSDSIGEE